MKDVIVVGGGIAGMATAARLQAAGLSTTVLESHGQVGGCAGFFRKAGFAFDVGATTLVDFEPGGVGGDLLDTLGMSPIEGEALPGYAAWLPDRCVRLYRDHSKWAAERLTTLGDDAAHRAFWSFLDQVAQTFWQASRNGIKLPIRTMGDLLHSLRALPLNGLPLARFVNWTMGDAVRYFGLRDDLPLTGLLAMLIEDTVHSTLDAAPLINAALGVTIRGAGLTRHRGGMFGFWQKFISRYRALGGELRVGCRVDRIEGQSGAFTLHTQRGLFEAAQVVSAVPAAITARIAPSAVSRALQPFLCRDQGALGGAFIVFLGVPEEQISEQAFTHHQLLQAYDVPLGYGNNMFVSVSAEGDTESAPVGCRAVVISTHCNLDEWKNLSVQQYTAQKHALADCLVDYARRVYPALGQPALVYEIGTPHTYETYTGRPDGAVGGVRQTLANSNQNAVPYNLGLNSFWLVGDSTWPGLGTVACVLGSRHVADEVSRHARKFRKGV